MGESRIVRVKINTETAQKLRDWANDPDGRQFQFLFSKDRKTILLIDRTEGDGLEWIGVDNA